MNDWFNERYIKEIPIEEQIRGQVRAECHYMDKADIYEWITQNQIKIMNLQSKIDKANELLGEILVVSDWEHKGRFRPVKNTTAQDVYKTIVMLNELLETPRKINYELLKEDKLNV